MSDELERMAAGIADGDGSAGAPGTGDAAKNLAHIDAIARAFRNESERGEAAHERLFRWRHLDVETLVGEGGFGRVYKAWDPVLKRHVALKLAQADRSGVPDDLLVAEARRMARVRHPHVLAVHGADRDGDEVGIWSDLIEGRTVEALVEAEGPMVPADFLALAERLCDALVIIHQRGITHGDIKPANVMLRASGEPVLMDFGAGAGRGFYGSPLAMAPELFREINVSFAADVYAMGVLFYFALTGRYPVEAPSFEALAEKHAQRANVSFGEVPRSMRALLRDCLAHDAAQRPSAAELLARLRWLLETPRRRRRRLVAGTVMVSLVLALAATGAGLWRTSVAREAAEQDRLRAEASLRFLTDMLAAPRLSEHGPDVKVVEMLEEAGRQLAIRELADEQASRLHFALAESYASLEDYEPASRHFSQALALTSDPTQYAETLARQVQLERGHSHYDQAEAHLETLTAFVDSHRSELPDYFPLYLTYEQGMTAVYRGDQSTARRLLEAVDADPDGLPAWHEANFLLWSALSNLYRDEAQLERALEYSERSLAWHVEYGDGAGSYDAVRSRHSLATVMAVAQRYTEAEALTRQNIDYLDAIDSRWSGLRMGVTLVLIEMLVEQGRAAEAVQRLEALAARAREHFGGGPHRSLLTVVGQLGPAHFELGQYARAEAATREALAMAEALMGPDSGRARLYRSNIAEFLLYQNRGPEALTYARDTYETNVAQFGATHLFSLFTADVYGAALVRWGDAQAGLELLDETLAHKLAQFGAGHAFTWDTQKYRIEALRSVGERTAARELAGRTHAHFVSAKGTDHHKTRAVAALLVDLEGA